MKFLVMRELGRVVNIFRGDGGGVYVVIGVLGGADRAVVRAEWVPGLEVGAVVVVEWEAASGEWRVVLGDGVEVGKRNGDG